MGGSTTNYMICKLDQAVYCNAPILCISIPEVNGAHPPGDVGVYSFVPHESPGLLTSSGRDKHEGGEVVAWQREMGGDGPVLAVQKEDAEMVY